eukprot:Em0019g707a
MFGQGGRLSLSGNTSLNSSIASPRRSLQPASKNTPNAAARSARADQVLEETSLHVVKALSTHVPVQVREALRTDSRTATVKLHDSSWAWLVVGSKVMLWRYSVGSIATTISPCRALPLPFSSTGWKADLVTVCTDPSGSGRASVLAVSPEGTARYWSNITSDNPPYVEAHVGVGESSSTSLANLPSTLGCLLLTSQAHLFIIWPPAAGGGQSGSGSAIVVRQLHIPRGVLSGFGKRISSFIFGSQEVAFQEARGMVVTNVSAGQDVAFVLTNTHLQKWQLSSIQEEQQYEISMETILKDALMKHKWFSKDEDPVAPLLVWTVDVQVTSMGVAVLFVATRSTQGDDQPMTAKYGLGMVATDNTAPVSLDRLVDLNYDCPYKPGNEPALLAYCLHSNPSSSLVMLYHRNAVLLIDLRRDTLCEDIVQFPVPNAILGKGACDQHSLFFTLSNGVISISSVGTVDLPTPTRRASILGTPGLSGRSVTSVAMATSHYDATEYIELLKNSFMEYLNGNVDMAFSLCRANFPPESFAGHLNTPCDLAVCGLSELVLNDLPSSDPRWSDSSEHIRECLFHDHTFLTDVGLLDQLTCVTVRNRPMCTCYLLREHAEKIVAATSLKRAHNQLVDQAIRLVLQQRPSSGAASRPGLSNQDLFYTQVTDIDAVISALFAYEENRLHMSSDEQEETADLIIGVGTVMVEGVFREALQYRKNHSALYQPYLQGDQPEPEFVPWTASTGAGGTRSVMIQQLDLMISVGVRETQGTPHEQTLWQCVEDMIIILLDGYKTQLKSLEKDSGAQAHADAVRTEYEVNKHKYISSLLSNEQLKQASELAETYEDFGVLIDLCDTMKDRNKLREYMNRFSEQGFSNFLFKRLLDEGNLQQLLSYSEDFPEQLEKFLQPHNHLNWLHQIAIGNFTGVYKTLEQLAEVEDKYIAKKKTLLSISKIAALASDVPQDEKDERVEALNHQLQLIEYQENLPAEVLDADGLDLGTMPPLSPEKLVQLYVRDEKEPLHFLYALELLDFAHPDRDSQESKDLRVYIWSMAALKDDWSKLDTDNPLEQLQLTFFFNVVEQAYSRGMKLQGLLPPVEELLKSDLLHGLTKDKSFQFLMRAGYEQLERVYSTTDIDLDTSA